MKRVESAYILAGGQSSRFGVNKALVSILGEPLIVRLANQLASDGLEMRLVAQKISDYESLGIPTIEDGQTNGGPMAGVLAALADCQRSSREWCFICSCDMLDWQPQWQVALTEAISLQPDCSAAVLSGEFDDAHTFRPFPGLYRASLLGIARDLWDEGVRSMRGFHGRIASEVRFCRTVAELLPRCFNTPEELAERLAGGGQS